MLYRTVSLENKSIIIDAKQRILLNKSDPHHDGERILCIEPPPDVAQAISSALSLKNQDRDAMVSLNESIIQLGERLAVIQLLRDRMYRACEAYANGAIDRVSYVLMLARIDKTMITLLSQEMIAGAFREQIRILRELQSWLTVFVKTRKAVENPQTKEKSLITALEQETGEEIMKIAQTEIENLITQYNKIAPSDSLTLFGMNVPTILDDDGELDKAIDEVIMKLKDKDTELLKDLKVIESSELAAKSKTSADEAGEIREQIKAGRELIFQLEVLKAKTAVMEDAQTKVENLITQYNKIAPSDSQTLFGMNVQTLLDDDEKLNNGILILKDEQIKLRKKLGEIKSSESPTTKENAFIEVCINQVFGKRAKGGFVSLRHEQEKILRESNLGDKVKERLKMLESDLTAHVHD